MNANLKETSDNAGLPETYDWNKFCIVVASCDLYKPLLPNFFYLLHKYWPGHPESIGITNESHDFYKDTFLKRRRSNQGTWSGRLLRELDLFPDKEYVFLLLDDYYLEGYVDLETIYYCANYMEQSNKCGAIFFEEAHGRKTRKTGSRLMRVLNGKYKTSAAPSLWRIKYLKKILRSDENAWQFEYRGSFRAWFCSERCFCLASQYRKAFPYEFGGVMVRGQAMELVMARIEEAENIKIPRIFGGESPLPAKHIERKSLTRFIKNRWKLFKSLFSRRGVWPTIDIGVDMSNGMENATTE